MDRGFKIVREGASFTVEGFFQHGKTQRFRSASGFKSEAEARQWAHSQQVKEMDQAAETDAQN